MKLVEIHTITEQHPFFKEIDNLCFLSKNLYNSALYEIRQEYFTSKKYINWVEVINRFTKIKQQDYSKLPAKVSQQTIKKVHDNFLSFFALLKKKDMKAKIPKYLDKVDGRFAVTYTNQAISKRDLKKGIIHPSKTNIRIKTKCSPESIQQVSFVRFNKLTYKVLVVYNKEHRELKEDNGRYASIDLGVNNLATLSSNVMKPIIYNGRPLKSINQFYSKQKSVLQQKSKKQTSNKIIKLGRKRNNKINDYLHKTSRMIVNHLVENDIHTLIVGYNKGWKQETTFGCVNNQKFVMIPFHKFLSMLQYKCSLEGIQCIINEESYTSKCSFLDGERIERHEKYKGKRIKRGLYESSTGRKMNADLNGSLNILRKVIGDFQYSIEVCSTPLKVTPSIN